MATSYDEIQYPSYPYPLTQPDNLSVVARCFGLRTPPPETCRVLELGSAAGGNLMPLAERYPDARLVGIDLSAREIEDGQATVRALGLTNVELRQGDIGALGDELGEFDYVLCHGVYSWVPDTVQDRILELCGRLLPPNGVAYISYNTYPGWHMRGMLREIMCFHAARFTRPEDQIRQARMLLDFLASSTAAANDPYSLLLKSETDLLRRLSDSYLYHEHLEENNHPCYFFEFAQRAERHGLQYLGDAALSSMMTHGLKPETVQTLHRVADNLIEMEQYLDFVRNRMFRASLLCRKEASLTRTLAPAVMHGLHISAAVRLVGPVGSGGAREYRMAGGQGISTESQAVQGALELLGEAWPESLPTAVLAERLAARLGVQGRSLEPETEGVLLNLYSSGLVEAAAAPARCVRQAGDRPRVTPLARWQAAHGDWVTTLRHTICKCDEPSRVLLPLLDGAHDRASLMEAWVRATAEGRLTIHKDGAPVADPAEARVALAGALPACLDVLARNGVLLA